MLTSKKFVHAENVDIQKKAKNNTKTIPKRYQNDTKTTQNNNTNNTNNTKPKTIQKQYKNLMCYIHGSPPIESIGEVAPSPFSNCLIHGVANALGNRSELGDLAAGVRAGVRAGARVGVRGVGRSNASSWC